MYGIQKSPNSKFKIAMNIDIDNIEITLFARFSDKNEKYTSKLNYFVLCGYTD